LSPARGESVVVPGPAGDLQAVVDNPETSATGLYGVICHPHPLYGGTLDNKVVTTLARALLDLQIPSVRFNFRGVGSSAGSFDQGKGETEDAVAVADWAAARWPGRGMVAAGFSFGGFVALKLALSRAAAHLVTVAPAIRLFEPTQERPSCPWLLVQGEADEVVDPIDVATWAASLAPPPHLVMLPGVGHFFHGRLNDLRGAVVDAIRNG
jgi:alpha/beta superfamily hydrolase